MLKNMKLMAAMLLIVAFAVNCPKKKNDDDTAIAALLLYVNDQQSGNCAGITKSGTGYSASLSPVPKGGCNLDTLLGGTTVASRKTFVINSYKNTRTLLATYSECQSTTNVMTDAVIENHVNSAYNKTQESIDTEVSNAKYVSIGNLLVEGATRLTALRTTYPTLSANLTVSSLNDYRTIISFFNVLLGQNGVSTFTTLAATNGATDATACGTKVNTEYTALTKVNLIDFGGTVADPALKTNAMTVQCKYGTSATDADRCVSLNDQF